MIIGAPRDKIPIEYSQIFVQQFDRRTHFPRSLNFVTVNLKGTNMLRLAILAIGAAAGFGYGYQTRPSLLGVQVPLNVLTSNHPMDAAFKANLASHLAVTTAVGFGIALIIVLALTAIVKGGNKAV